MLIFTLPGEAVRHAACIGVWRFQNSLQRLDPCNDWGGGCGAVYSRIKTGKVRRRAAWTLRLEQGERVPLRACCSRALLRLCLAHVWGDGVFERQRHQHKKPAHKRFEGFEVGACFGGNAAAEHLRLQVQTRPADNAGQGEACLLQAGVNEGVLLLHAGSIWGQRAMRRIKLSAARDVVWVLGFGVQN